MFPATYKMRGRQQGVSLIMAIFIIVVLSLLGAVMIKLLKTGAGSIAREVISTRALLAAESGAQRQLVAIFPPGSSNSNTAACQLGVNYTMAALISCNNVVVDCEYVTVDGTNYFTITSTGRCGPVGEEAVRIVEVQAKDGS